MLDFPLKVSQHGTSYNLPLRMTLTYPSKVFCAEIFKISRHPGRLRMSLICIYHFKTQRSGALSCHYEYNYLHDDTSSLGSLSTMESNNLLGYIAPRLYNLATTYIYNISTTHDNAEQHVSTGWHALMKQDSPISAGPRTCHDKSIRIEWIILSRSEGQRVHILRIGTHSFTRFLF